MSDEINQAEALSNEQAVEQARESPKALAPRAAGNHQITVFKHALVNAAIDPQDVTKKTPAGIEVAIGNVLDTTISTAVFEALFYDQSGKVLETVKHTEVDLRPKSSRAIFISSLQDEAGLVQSYDVRLIRTRTADVEKVQPRRHGIRKTETGEEVVEGIVKNISQVKTDSAIVVTFYDINKENIGTRVVLLRDIQPDTIRQYALVFKPPEGDTVGGFGVAIGEMAA